MELKAYLRILARKWWIILPTFLVTFTSTVVFTVTQAPVYEAKTTFVVTPNDKFESFAYGLDLLSRRSEISSTYAEVASSNLIESLAADELGLSPEQRKSLSIEGRLLAGTNVLEIAAQGNDPVLVTDFANTVGAETVAYVEDLYETYNLRPLDQATQPTLPIEPDRKLNLALGGILGLALSVGLAILSEYLQAPLESVTNFGILDDETGVYNKRYFMQRLKQEMSRAKRNSYPMSLALINVDCIGVMDTAPSQIRSEALRRAAMFLKQFLRDEDVMARLGDTVFAVLLPDMPGERAKETMEWLQTRMAWTPFELEKSGIKLNLCGIAGVAAYQYNGTGQNELLAQATRALEEAETAGYGQVCLFAENGDPLSISDSEK